VHLRLFAVGVEGAVGFGPGAGFVCELKFIGINFGGGGDGAVRHFEGSFGGGDFGGELANAYFNSLGVVLGLPLLLGLFLLLFEKARLLLCLLGVVAAIFWGGWGLFLLFFVAGFTVFDIMFVFEGFLVGGEHEIVVVV
jgi:hypothetical protein